MYIQVEKTDLFKILNDPDPKIRGNVVAAHCIASDFGMFGGIARQFVLKMDMRQKLLKWANQKASQHEVVVSKNPYDHDYGTAFCSLKGTAVKIGNVYNLITKTWTYEKPDYETVLSSLKDMRRQMEENRDSLVVIPKLGCGIDGLNWQVVKAILTSVFYDTNVIFIVADLKADERDMDEDEHFHEGKLDMRKPDEYEQFMDAWEKVFEQPFMGSDFV